MIKLIVGLGNPGKKYEKTRHNIGFVFADLLCKDFPDQKYLKPQDFMNNSGISVAKQAKYSNTKPDEILVVHDELDLAVGEWRLHFDRGPAGHNGVKSIVEQLGTKAFWRLRIGIGKAETIPVEDYVLMPFSKEEINKILSLYPEITTSHLFKQVLP